MTTQERIQAVLDERSEWGDSLDFFDEVNANVRTISSEPGRQEITETSWAGIRRVDTDTIRNGAVAVSESEWSIDPQALDPLSVWMRFEKLGWVTLAGSENPSKPER